jgi:hypothetical protein
MKSSIQNTRSSIWWRLPRDLFLLILLLMILVPMAHGRDFVVKRNLQGYTMEVSINRNPPILGKNDIKVEIRDSLGKHVVDAPVKVNYFMPPMPGMAPMNYTVKASPHDTGYGATMDLIMKGPWNIVIRADVAGKPIRMTVLIDVR